MAAIPTQRSGCWSQVIREVSAGDPGVVVVSVDGEIDMVTLPMLSTALHRQLGRPGCRVLIADLTGVDFFAVRGLAVLEQVNQRARSMSVAFWLAGCPRAVLRPLEVTQLLGAFRRHPTVAAAVSAAEAISARR